MTWLIFASLLTGCGGGEAPPPTPTCELSLDNLEGQTFLMYEAQPDGKTYKENVLARMKFFNEDGLLARYTVGSLSDVYDFNCTLREKGEDKELYCAEKERPEDWCQALEVHESGSCTKKKLRKLGMEALSDDEVVEGIKKAKETIKKFKGTDKWDHFVLNNNNLGNKLQGRLYVKVDEKRCRLSVSDMYFTIFDGKGIEDTNPVGINPFVKSDEDFMFKHCKDGMALAALTQAGEPEDWGQVNRMGQFETGQEVFYRVAPDKAGKAEEGCSYSYDTYYQWKKGEEGIEAKISEDRKTKDMVIWKASHTYAKGDPQSFGGKTVGVAHMARFKTCDGKKEEIDVICNASVVMDM